MSKKIGKERKKLDESGDGFSEDPGTSGLHAKSSSKEFASPLHKKIKKKQSSYQKPVKEQDVREGEQKEEQFQTQQQHSAWGKGSPLRQPQQQQQQQQSQPPQQQQQDVLGKGSPFRQPQQQQQQQPPPQQQQQDVWGKGSPFRQPQQQQQQQQQQQGIWGRGSPFRQPQQQQPPPQQQQQDVWGKGSPFRQPQQQQQQGIWGRGSPFRQPQQQQPPPQQQQQDVWGKGSPFRQPQQQQQQQQQPPPQQQQQDVWGKGSPFRQPQQQQQQQQQQQGIWGRGSPFRQPQQQQPPPQQQQQDVWGKGSPFRQHQPQPQQQQQSPLPGSSKSISEFRIPKKSESKDKEKGFPKKPRSSDIQELFEFAPRITASKRSGRSIVVATNFFPLTIKNPNITVHHYNVVMEPDKPKFLLRAVWNKYVALMFPGRLTAFDGKNAYSKGPLTTGGSTSATVTVLNTESNRDKEFTVSIEEVRRISLSSFHNYRERMIESRSMKALPEAEMTVLDIILRNWACENFIRNIRHFFPLSTSHPLTHDLSEKLCLRIGYFQSAFLGYEPYLNFDISHKAFYKECHLLDIIDKFRHRHTKSLDVEEMNHFIRNVKIEYQMPNDPSTRKIFRVNKLVDDANSQSFTKEDGKRQTVAQYFQTEKNYMLRFPELPLLWVGPTQKSIYLPMELCRIIPDQIYRGLMDSSETREMVRNATSNARDRKKDVVALFEKVNINSHPLMREFGLHVSDEMAKVPARVLDPPRLKTSRSIKVEDGVWRIQDFLEPKCLRKWCILNLDNRINKQNLMSFQKMLKTKGIEYKMQIADPSREPLNGVPNFDTMKKAFSQLKDMEMVFVVISEAKGVYSRVKAICETQEGVLTQCVKSKTLSQDPRKLMTTVQNILLKVNAKLGGKNHCLDRSSVPECLNGYVMIVGADVTHPSPGMKIPSVAAVTVSCDPAAFQYGTTTRVQPKGEIIRDLEEIISIHMKNFYQIRKKYPDKIIFFRDGVSEGELPKVFTSELLALKKACTGYCEPKITFVVVQKRHHTRFYPTSWADEQGKNFNVPVGTCVDSNIVHPRDLDFYLVSHASILGTARPTRYRLLHDDNKLTDDELETLSYYLCHLFSRCNRSVSYPSPTYNAHLAAARVRAHLEGLNLMSGQDIEIIKKEMRDHISGISPMYFV